MDHGGAEEIRSELATLGFPNVLFDPFGPRLAFGHASRGIFGAGSARCGAVSAAHVQPIFMEDVPYSRQRELGLLAD
jgi:hypothetical protein